MCTLLLAGPLPIWESLSACAGGLCAVPRALSDAVNSIERRMARLECRLGGLLEALSIDVSGISGD